MAATKLTAYVKGDPKTNTLLDCESHLQLVI